MSLKAFHIFFLIVSIFCSLFFGMWAVNDWRATGETGTLVLGILSFVALAALIPYGIWFLRKLRNVGYL